jgi:methionyl-tRNA synthetase
MKKRVLVTSALPYANGQLHIGHILSYLNADIWVRFKKTTHIPCYHICGSDMHGTPIMISAKKENTDPIHISERYAKLHQEIFALFSIHFDHYQSTNHLINNETVNNVFRRLVELNKIKVVQQVQPFDEVEKVFLPDRFLSITCPFCQAKDRDGNSCSQCGKKYDIKSLDGCISSLSGTKPTFYTVEQYAISMEGAIDILMKWEFAKNNPHMMYILEEWKKEGIRDWIISRDSPYHGFLIPQVDSIKFLPNKYFYVWFDAPINYLSMSYGLTEKEKISFYSFWQDPEAEIHQYLGKDIIYFHTIFWPTILAYLNYNLPTTLQINGFLTFEKAKMSKSEGNKLLASSLADLYETDYFRYYAARKLTNEIIDVDFNLLEFSEVINKELIAKLLNIANRTTHILESDYNNILLQINDQFLSSILEQEKSVNELYEARKFSCLIKKIILLATQTNKFINDNPPWILRISDPKKGHQVCSIALESFRILIGYLRHIIPQIASKIESYFQYPYADKVTLITHNLQLKKFYPPTQKITQESIKELRKLISCI